MIRLTFSEFVYFGVLISALAVYLPLYIKLRPELDSQKRHAVRWGIVASFAAIGIIGVFSSMISWLPALLSAGLACLCAYYIIFIKYKD